MKRWQVVCTLYSIHTVWVAHATCTCASCMRHSTEKFCLRVNIFHRSQYDYEAKFLEPREMENSQPTTAVDARVWLSDIYKYLRGVIIIERRARCALTIVRIELFSCTWNVFPCSHTEVGMSVLHLNIPALDTRFLWSLKVLQSLTIKF